jgi:neutral ceramidase
MLAGTADGEGVGKQGMTCDTVGSVIPGFACQVLTTSCQGVKPIALQTGLMKPYPWTPNVLPFQILRVGNFFIAASSFELTTMSGRRIKETLSQQLPQNENHPIVLSALANAYVQYLTTYEEYQLQRYEGASTLFGPWTLAAVQQQYARLAKSLMSGDAIEAGPTPPDLLDFQINLQTDVVYDSVPLSRQFGDVYQDVKANYLPGDTVSIIFWGAHPKNNYRTQDTFLAVQRLENGEWKTVRQDRDWDTEYHWQRSGMANSLITIVWRIPTDMIPGQYRIVHYGDRKAFWSGNISPYMGYSSVFSIA